LKERRSVRERRAGLTVEKLRKAGRCGDGIAMTLGKPEEGARKMWMEGLKCPVKRHLWSAMYRRQ